MLTEDDKKWISAELGGHITVNEARMCAQVTGSEARMCARLEKMQAALVAEFRKLALPEETPLRRDTSPRRILELELETLQRRVDKLERH
jgi:hypothetical protein